MNDKKLICIIGSTKCGTTTLFDWLNQVSFIEGAVRKETRYFMPEYFPLHRSYHYEDGAEEYKKFFLNYNNSEFLLDATPDYMYSNVAIRRVLDNYKDCYFIIIRRNPVDRFISWFHFAKQIGAMNMNITLREFFEMQLENMDISKPQHLNALCQGHYEKYINNIMPLVGDRLLVIDLEEMKSTPDNVIKKISRLISKEIPTTSIDFSVSNETLILKNNYLQKKYRNLRNYLNAKTAFYPKIHNLGRFCRKKLDLLLFSNCKVEKQSKPVDVETISKIKNYYD